MALLRFSEGQLKESIPRLCLALLFQGSGTNSSPNCLYLPGCGLALLCQARDKTVPRTVLFIQVPDVFIILFDGAVR